jgi:murein DD-endopeptidase MepM/ murein hydrolase activator NlpD
MIIDWVQTSIKIVRLGVIVIIIAFCSVAILSLSGCISLFVKPYGYVTPDAEKARDDGRAVVMPENAPSISQGYRPQRIELSGKNTSSIHEGIDIIAKAGTPVIAPAAGIVISSYFEPFYGSRVVIDHGKDENGMFIKSRYFHLKKRLVKKGEKVVRGQKIGTMGRTGLLSAGISHLHYEIWRGVKPGQSIFKPMNPHKFWVDGIGNVTCYDSSRKWVDRPFRTTYPVPCREDK